MLKRFYPIQEVGRHDYVECFDLTPREHRRVASMPGKNRRAFMVKRMVLVAAMSLAMIGSANAQIITESPSNLLQWASQLEEMKRQWETLQNQLEKQAEQLEAMTGSAGYGRAFGNSAREYQENFPEEWGEVYNGDDYWSMASDAIDSLDDEIAGMDRQEAIEHTRRRVREKNAHDRAVMEQVYNNQLAEMREIERLTEEIDRATTQKEIEDLQARIQTAQGAIQAEQVKVTNMASLQQAQQRLYEDQAREAFMRRMIGNPDETESPEVTNRW